MDESQDSPTTQKHKQHQRFDPKNYGENDLGRIEEESSQTINLEETTKSHQDIKFSSLKDDLTTFQEGIKSLQENIGNNTQVKPILSKASGAAEELFKKLPKEEGELTFPADKKTQNLITQLKTFNNSHKSSNALPLLLPMLMRIPNTINDMASTITEGISQAKLNPESPDKEIKNQSEQSKKEYPPLFSEETRNDLISVYRRIQILNPNTLYNNKTSAEKTPDEKEIQDLKTTINNARKSVEEILNTLDKYKREKLKFTENDNNHNLMDNIENFLNPKDEISKLKALEQMPKIIEKVTEGIRQVAKLQKNAQIQSAASNTEDSSHAPKKNAGRVR